ncbi:MAG: hypothetical protein P8Y97_14135 [Candidatus Lokiarchaeota archaeon]
MPNCQNNDPKKLEPFKKEEYEDEGKHIKKIYVKCRVCGGTFQFKFEEIKKVAKPTKKKLKTEMTADDEEEALSMGLAYALDENGKNLGHIGYF